MFLRYQTPSITLPVWTARFNTKRLSSLPIMPIPHTNPPILGLRHQDDVFGLPHATSTPTPQETTSFDLV